MTDQRTPKRRNASVAIFFMVTVASFIGFISVLPLFPSYAANPWTSENDCGVRYETGAWGGASCTITVANTGDTMVIAGHMTLRSGSSASMSIQTTSGPQNIVPLCQNPIQETDVTHGNQLAIWECKNIAAGTYNMTVCTACSNIPPASCAGISCGNYAIWLYALNGHAMKFWNSSGTNTGSSVLGSSNSVGFTGPIAVVGFSTTSSNTATCTAAAGYALISQNVANACYRSGNSNAYYAGEEWTTFSSSGSFTTAFNYDSTPWSVEGIGWTFSNIIITTITTTLTVTGMVAPNLQGDGNWQWLIGLFFLLFPVAILDSMVVTPIGPSIRGAVESHVEGDTVIFTTLLGLFIGSIIGVMPTINALPLAFPFMFGVLFVVYWYVGRK